MKKSLLLGAALVVGVTGFSQNAARKAVNPKYLQKTSVVAKTKVVAEPKATTSGLAVSRKAQNSNSAACNNAKQVTTSYNCFGVGGGSTTSSQNCLSYNKDLNTLVWTQRGSKTWALNTTSGCMQSTLIDATTLATDSVVVWHDDNTSAHHARYPSGTFLNANGNTDRSKALIVAYGQVTDGSNWTGAAYVAKPLSSASAVNHTNPGNDSLYAAASPAGIFGACAAGNLTGAPATDVQALSDGKTVVSVGGIDDANFTATDNVANMGAMFVKATANANNTAVTWDTISIRPDVHVGTLGHSISEPRMAFGPDGMTGYIVFTGLLNTVYNNYSDSSFTPIVYKTTDGGAHWTQKLAGYDWMCHHPEVEKNVGELVGQKRFYTFDMGLHGADVTVDANNVLHFVTCVSQSTFKTGDVDSVGIYAPTYQYDFVNYHPIIWDFMTDGNDWKTMMVDSIISADCGSSSTDTTSTHSAMGGSQILGVSSHITVSRSLDGTKVFYGWADSDPSITGQVFNINPDVLMKAYDVTLGKVSATKNITNIGTCFYPYLSDFSFQDASQNWVVPAVYTTGNVIAAQSPQTTYDASSQADYYLTNCGTFAGSDLSVTASINNPLPGPCYSGIKTNNAFESSISNYPNPFNGTTTIAVNLSENKAFNVNVYNAIGTLVYSKKVNGNVGENTVSFDGSALSAGVYYYTVTAGNQQATKKMIIQK